MDRAGLTPVDVNGRKVWPETDGLKWHVSMGVNFDATKLDDRVHWQMQGMDPNKVVRNARAVGDREAVRRGLMFVGERRLGDEIQRQYIAPTFWWRLRFLILKPRLEKPRKRR